MSKGKGIVIQFKADASPVKSALAQIDKASRTLVKQLGDIDKLLEFDPTNINLLTQKQDLLQKAVAATTEHLKGMEDAQKDITAGYQKWQQNQQAIEKNASAIAKMTSQLEEAKTEMDAMWSAVGNGSAAEQDYEEAAKKVAELTKNIEDLRKQQKALASDPQTINEDTYQRYLTTTERLRQNLQQLGVQQEQVNAAIADGGRSAEEAAQKVEAQAKAEAEFETAVRRAAEAEKWAKQSTEDLKSALDKLKTSANNVKNDIKEMASVAAAGVTAIGSAVAAGTKAVTKTGMEFSKSMSNVQALSGATANELKSLRDAASDAGANTSKTASEAADALGYMALAGWDTQQMLDGLMPVLRASEAGAMDLATCSDLVTDSMSAMGIAVGDLQHYLDVCAKTQSSANTSMEELLQAYVECGGMLKTLNVPLETSAALLGTLANRGIKGSEAGKALNSVLVNLIGANKNAASAMKDMGASAFDAKGHFIGLEETLKLVKSKLDEYGDDTEKITQLEAKLGGKTQLDTLQALLSGVSEEYDTLNNKILNCNGALEATAKAMQDNLSGDITSLQAALEGVEDTIFSSFEEPFRTAAQNVTKELRDLNAACSEGEIADGLRNSAQALSDFITKMSAFAADEAFPTLIKWLGWVTDHADAIISAIKGMGAAWASWKIMQYATHLQELVNAINLVRTASVTSAAAQDALAVSGASAAASEEALAAAAQTMATAQMIAYAAVIALTAALASFVAQQIDAAAENLKHKNQLDEETQALYDQAAAYEETRSAIESQSKVIESNAEKSKLLWEKVKDLVDEEGRAKGSSEELQEAVAALNTVAGTNITVLNGQIQGYKDLAASMDEVIARSEREAKMSFMQEGYEEAIYNIDDITEKYEAAQKEKWEAYEDYQKKAAALQEAEARGYSNDKPYLQLREEADAAKERWTQAEVELSALTSLKNGYEQTITEYNDLLTEPLQTSSPTKEAAAREAAENDAARIVEQNRQTAELAKLGVKQTWEDLETSLEELDTKLAIKAIPEDEYWENRRKLLEDSQYRESVEWWKYYDEVTTHYDKLAETEAKAQEEAQKKQQEAAENQRKQQQTEAEALRKQQQEEEKKQQEELENSIKDQIDAVKERQELDNSYTKKQMYNDMEIIISGLDKESEIYKKYNSEILKGRKALADESAKTIADGFKAEVSEAESAIKELVSDYQSSLKQLMSARDTYFNKLFDISSFTSRSTQTDTDGNTADIFSLSDPEEAYQKLVKYEKAVEDLKARGVSENVMDWIDTLDAQTAQDTIDVLSNMTDSSLKQYSDSFDKFKAKAEQMADDRYAPQIDELNEQFASKVDGVLADLPELAGISGEQTASEYIKGLNSKGEDVSEAVSTFAGNIIDNLNTAIDNYDPSEQTKDIGERTVKSFALGLASFSMSDAVGDLADSFLSKLAKKDPAIRSALEDTFMGNLSDVMDNVGAAAGIAMSSVFSALKIPNLPDITKMSLPSESTVSSAVNNSDISAVLGRMDTIISLIESVKVTSDGQQIKLQLELNGKLTADTNSIAAVIAQKFNNLSIQTGKKVFSY